MLQGVQREVRRDIARMNARERAATRSRLDEYAVRRDRSEELVKRIDDPVGHAVLVSPVSLGVI